APPARSWSGPDAFRHHARPGGPTGGALRPCSPISRQRIESSPTVTGARGHGRRPSARRVHAARGSTCWVVAWAPSSLGMSPPTNPVRFMSSGALGILTFDGTSLTTLVAAPHMTAFGTWLYDSNKDRILAIGDFDHDFRDEILVVRPADADGRGRVGILKYNGAVSDQAKRLMPLFVATDETWFGGWRFQSAVNRIVGTADINGDGRKDIVITSAWG